MRAMALLILAALAACNPRTAGNSQAAEANVTAAPAPADKATASRAFRCPPPLSWGALRGSGDAQPPIDPVRNTTSVDTAGHIYWNDTSIDMATLRQYLQLTATMNPRPVFHLEADPRAPCPTISSVIALAGSLLECTHECTYAERAVDPRRMRPAAPRQASYSVHASNPRRNREDGTVSQAMCGEGDRTFTLTASQQWSPWTGIAPGCSLGLVVGPGDPPLRADSYVTQCSVRSNLTTNCSEAEFVRFGLAPSLAERGDSLILRLRSRPID